MIRNMLDLSTGHIPLQHPNFGCYRYEPHQYGWIVFVDPNPEYLEDLGDSRETQWLEPIMSYAIKNNCILINFDQDADYGNFKTFGEYSE